MLVPGGLRLLAHEISICETRGRGGIPDGAERYERAGSKRGVEGATERALILLELIRFRASRIMLLRAAGMRLAEQRRVRDLVA